ncbi:MAG: hypothetical protein IRZ16_15630 [Myxococcaceae bacterium]|nr:hypothetical protein [Myxococcaceae bacterium]
MRARTLWIGAAVGAVAIAACTIEVDGAVGKECETAFDCPDDLVCVQARAGVGKTCEALAGPSVGTFETEDAGVVFYCDGAKTVLDTFCISCHTVPPAGNAPATFRLDAYESDGGVLGAKDMAQRVYLRAAVTHDMPPPPDMPIPAADQAILAAWFKSGAQFCDAGMSSDAGTSEDGGP